MIITCAQSVAYAEEAFSTLGDVRVLADRDICREFLLDTDALIVRSKTLITRDLLEHTPVRFVGTATAGTDHVDIPYLRRNGIVFANAPGCNANAVAEHVIAALLQLAQKYHVSLHQKTLGVIGVGQVGSRVVEKAAVLGMRVLQNDPFRAIASPEAADWLSLEELLPQADIVTLHAPLTTEGRFATRHLLSHVALNKLPVGAWLLNTARGAIVDSEALQCALEHDFLQACVLDVWENEPSMPAGLFERLDLATPHIAGYSVEGHLNGTFCCYRELCHFLEQELLWTLPAENFPREYTLDAALLGDEEALALITAAAYPLAHVNAQWRDEAAFAADEHDLVRRFDRFRKQHTSSRREFCAHPIHLTNASETLLNKIAALGFSCVAC